MIEKNPDVLTLVNGFGKIRSFKVKVKEVKEYRCRDNVLCYDVWLFSSENNIFATTLPIELNDPDTLSISGTVFQFRPDGTMDVVKIAKLVHNREIEELMEHI